MTIDITTTPNADRLQAWDGLLDSINRGVAAAIAEHQEQLEAAGLFLNTRELRNHIEELAHCARAEGFKRTHPEEDDDHRE